MYFWKTKDPKEDTRPKVIENTKRSLVLQGKKTNDTVKGVLSDLHLLRRAHSIRFSKRNDVLPFEDSSSLEFFSSKNDASLFAFGSHQKKRPNNIVFGRTFDYKMFDMAEFGIEDYTPMTKSSNDMCQRGSKPCIIFQGSHFANEDQLKEVRSLFLDFFRMDEVKKINVLGLDHVIVVTSLDPKTLHFGHYAIKYAKSGMDVPQVQLVELGPFMKMTLRRTRLPSDELRKLAFTVPKELRKSKSRNKNVSRNALGDVEGRLHVKQQPIGQLSLRKYAAFRQQNIEDVEDLEEDAQGGENVRKERRQSDHTGGDDQIMSTSEETN